VLYNAACGGSKSVALQTPRSGLRKTKQTYTAGGVQGVKKGAWGDQKTFKGLDVHTQHKAYVLLLIACKCVCV
jgi:hypothetical protein